MSLRLILMRHAKSAWDSPAQDDHARPLNDRGRTAARALGRWLAAEALLPDQVISSDSQRTQETWAGLSLTLPPLQPVWQRSLYLATPETMVNALRTCTGRCVLLIGHNPGCAEFAEQILRDAPNHDRFWDYPTGATLVADLQIDSWAQIAWKSAKAHLFIVPRELE